MRVSLTPKNCAIFLFKVPHYGTWCTKGKFEWQSNEETPNDSRANGVETETDVSVVRWEKIATGFRLLRNAPVNESEATWKVAPCVTCTIPAG